MASQPSSHGNKDKGDAGSQPRHGSTTILVDYQLAANFLEQIEAVDPSAQVVTAFERTGDVDKGTGLENRRRLSDEELEPLLARADVLLAFGFPVEWLSKAPNLKWVHLASAGSDHMQRAGLFDARPDLLLTTSSGVHEVPISEHILAMILFFARGFNKAVRNQAQHNWERYTGDEAFQKTVCLVGYGPIARRTAAMCKALDMRVLAVRASLTEEQEGDEQVSRFYPTSRLNNALAESDYVVIAAPRTPQTEGMIGPEQFSSMKPGAFIINISRGALIDEGAMIEALQDGTLAGAGLDVFSVEPLPESSPLWDMPNVLVTPHNSGANPHYDRRAVAIFTANLARFLKGERLNNLVQKERGY